MKNALIIIGISVACVALAQDESWGAYYLLMLTGVGAMFFLTSGDD